MSKLMAPVSGSIDPSAQKPMPNNGSNAAGSAKAADGSSGAQKHTPTATSWPSLPQISRDRLTNFHGQGEVVALTTLAANVQLSRFPIALIEFQRCHFTVT